MDHIWARILFSVFFSVNRVSHWGLRWCHRRTRWSRLWWGLYNLARRHYKLIYVICKISRQSLLQRAQRKLFVRDLWFKRINKLFLFLGFLRFNVDKFRYVGKVELITEKYCLAKPWVISPARWYCDWRPSWWCSRTVSTVRNVGQRLRVLNTSTFLPRICNSFLFSFSCFIIFVIVILLILLKWLRK